MERLHRALMTGALLALGTGCSTFGKPTPQEQVAKLVKPDVMKPGVLPPPQEVMRASGTTTGGGLMPVSGTVNTNTTGTPLAAAAPTASRTPSVGKMLGRTGPKMPASEMQVAWGKQIAHLPDPTKNGTLGAGVAGQMFLFGGPRMEFVEADGVLTVDLVDDTPRPDGRPAAKAERWQFPKEVLRKMKTGDETFGKSYVVFLPWPDYRPDVTRVRISARYDQDDGHTIYAAPTTVTFEVGKAFGAPVWDGNTVTTTTPPEIRPGVSAGVLPSAGTAPLNPIQLPGPNVPVAVPAPGGTSVGSVPTGYGAPAPILPPQPFVPAPNLPPVPAAGAPSAPPGLGPVAPLPPGFGGR
jgi:hypothetical protein